MEEIKSW